METNIQPLAALVASYTRHYGPADPRTVTAVQELAAARLNLAITRDLAALSDEAKMQLARRLIGPVAVAA